MKNPNGPTVQLECRMCGNNYFGMRSSQYCIDCTDLMLRYNNAKSERKHYWKNNKRKITGPRSVISRMMYEEVNG